MLEEEDYENACHVRDTLLKFQEGLLIKCILQISLIRIDMNLIEFHIFNSHL